MNLLRLAGFGVVGFVVLASARGGDLSQEYNQVRKIALKDPKVRAAFDRANEKLNKRIVAIDPALKPYIEGQSATKTSREWRKQSPNLPGASASTTHIVAKGETLTSIAKRYRVSVNDLTKANRTTKEKTLHVGQRLVIPSAPPR